MDSEGKIKVLHVVGSPTSEYHFRVNLLYASACDAEDALVFCFAVVFPDGRWSFPPNLEESSLEASVKVGLDAAAAAILDAKPDVVHSHLICVGGQTIYRGMLFALGFPLIGSTPTAYALCKDKGLTRGALSALNFLPRGLVVNRWNEAEQIESWTTDGEFPCIVKAADLDDSIGLARVDEKEDLDAAVEKCFRAGAGSVIVEKFIRGIEIRIGVVECSGDELMMLPILHYAMSEDQIRDFDYKYSVDGRGIPTAKSPKNCSQFFDCAEKPDLKAKLEQLTFAAFRTLDLHDFALFDIRVDFWGVPWLLEIGLFCSFSKASVLNIMAQEVGISPNQLLSIVAKNAIKRHEDKNNEMQNS